MKTMSRLVCSAALLSSPALGLAFSGITDPANDFLGTFAGSASSTDLDVVSATVLYDATQDLYKLTSTQSGPVGSTATGFYVWGVNRGAGVASFAANGIDGVRFDRVVILRPDGSGSVGGAGDLPAGSVTVSGNTITGLVSGSLLPSTGFDKLDYTWNLWPRDGAVPSGFTAISDFAPDNANFTTTPGLVPEPQTYALWLAGLGALLCMQRRRAANAPRGSLAT
jgi:hypothetical protein